MDRLHARTCPVPCCGPTGDPIADDQLVPFFLTFGVNYAREPHPRGAWVHPDGYVVVFAPSYHEARTVVVDLFGRDWSDLYDQSLFSDPGAARRRYFPRGELLRITVPAGLVEAEDHRD